MLDRLVTVLIAFLSIYSIPQSMLTDPQSVRKPFFSSYCVSGSVLSTQETREGKRENLLRELTVQWGRQHGKILYSSQAIEARAGLEGDGGWFPMKAILSWR